VGETDQATGVTEPPGLSVNNMSRQQRTILFAAWAAMTGLALFVPAANDDWPLLTPILDFTWAKLLPVGLFWRPLEVLFRGVLGFVPDIFPVANHLMVGVGHGLSAWAVSTILRRFSVAAPVRFGVTLVFLVSQAGAATVFSVDGINQAWALAFGLCGALALMPRCGRVPWELWFVCAALSALTRESGLAFFAVGPVLAAAREAHLRSGREKSSRPWMRLAVGAALGAVGVAGYIGLRAWLLDSPNVFVGGGRYAIQFAPLVVVRNLGMLAGASVTTLDTVAAFLRPTNWWGTILSAACGLPLLVWLAGQSKRAAASPSTWLVAGAVVLASIPHALSPRPAEMYAYPTLGLVCILAGLLAANARLTSRWMSIGAAMVCFLVASTSVDIHKWWAMVSYGRSADVIAASIDAQTTGERPSTVCVVCRAQFWEGSESGYSIYYQPPEWASFWGMSVLPRWKWKNPKRFVYCTAGAACDPSCDATWVFPEKGLVIVSAGPPKVPR